MNKNIKHFIEENKQLIGDDDWSAFYGKAIEAPPSYINAFMIGQMTQMFLEADVNPLWYLEGVPSYFLYRASIDSFDIPAGAKYVGAAAFWGCESLGSVYIPSSVTEIGDRAFESCTALKSIVYQGTKEEWSKIHLGYAWCYRALTEVVHCTDGDLSL